MNVPDVREIDFRQSGENGISLLYDRFLNKLFIRIETAGQEPDEFQVERHRALDAFAHPFAYQQNNYNRVVT